MNRKIKFRAWDKKNKQWHYFEFPYDLFNYNWLEDKDRYEHFTQYIGLKDNTKWMDLTAEEQLDWIENKSEYGTNEDWNGVEIYEEDIVTFLEENWRIYYNSRNAEFTLTKDGVFEIRDFNWLDLGEGGYKQDIKKSGDIKIIGNIYDNKELLK